MKVNLIWYYTIITCNENNDSLMTYDGYNNMGYIDLRDTSCRDKKYRQDEGLNRVVTYTVNG